MKTAHRFVVGVTIAALVWAIALSIAVGTTKMAVIIILLGLLAVAWADINGLLDRVMTWLDDQDADAAGFGDIPRSTTANQQKEEEHGM